MSEKIPLQFATPEILREYISAVVQDGDESVGEAWKQIGDEVSSLYTRDVLNRSVTWHAFSLSTMKTRTEPLPESVELGISRVVNDLIERKLKPTLRS